MGNYKFRLADIMPNAWFYKLRDMSKKPRTQISSQTLNQKITKKKKRNTTFHNSSSSYSSSPSTTTTTTVSSKPNQPYQHSPRKSYYFTRDLNPKDYPNSPKNPPKPHQENHTLSKQRPRKRRPAAKQSQKQLLTRTGCKPGLESVWTKPDSSPEFTPEYSPERHFSGEEEFRCDGILSTNCAGKACSCGAHREADTVIDVDKASLAKKPDSPASEFDSFAKLELAPIITKPASKPKKKDNSNNNNNNGSPGIRLRINHSPRIINKRVSGLKKSATAAAATANSRRSRSLSDSFAVVKSSSDPQKDFRESMVEMIVENNITASKDLEDLLACYLSLNSDEYHGVIIKVFKQIWFDLTDIS